MFQNFHFSIDIRLKICFLFIFFCVNCEVYYDMSEDLITELYSKYKEAVADDDSSPSLRRLFKHNKEYNIHVNKLKEVNGYKKHNLIIRQQDNSRANPIIYINNPVESKIPNAYLTLEEFKKVLVNRVKPKIRDELDIVTKMTKKYENSSNRTSVRNITNKIPGKLSNDNLTTENTRTDIVTKTHKIYENVTLPTKNYMTTQQNDETTVINTKIREQNDNIKFEELTNITVENRSDTTFKTTESINKSIEKNFNNEDNEAKGLSEEENYEESSVDQEITTFLTTKSTTVKTTLGRPLVFMGGYN
ncbi:uncharacterized protein LOC116412935 [Galleria mellonella]|uniref:Uncharacterized protein LOC116412935 n=1 Tax=Galleria mellonella TaxID=7137 RepID=A0A6J3BZ87_GALME|nr:uncharacterized protein LOC116412935 [Galleria mellonella]